MKTSRIPAGTIAALLLPATVHAADRFWISLVSGNFADVANWSTTSGGAGGATVPGVADIANFTLNNPYTVAFAGAVTTAAIDLENGNVTFDLTGDTLTSTSGFGIDVGDTAALTGRLTVRGGLLGVDSEGDDVTLGVVPTSTGFLTVVANGRIGDGTIRPDVIVGSGGNGTLTMTDNGRVDGRNLIVGTGASSAGTLSINSAAAAMTMTGTADIGFSGAGALSIQNGGTLSVSGVSTLGENPGADGSTTVSGIGSAWAAAECNVGFGGKGALTVSGGGLVSVNNLNAGLSTSSSGVVTVTGPGSQLLGTGTQSFGVFGPGTLTISSGGRAEGSTTAILGTSSGSEGRATVSGAGSLWRVASSVFVGNSGAGTLTVSGGGEFQGGATTVGTGAAGVGVLTVTGAGSVATIGGSLLVGSLGSGTLNVESGAEVITGNLTINDPAGGPIGTLNLGGGSLFVGGDFVRSGVLNFPDGLLRVAGDFQANPGVAPFTLNGSTVGDLPVLDLVGSAATTNISTLVIGSNRRGELRLREGRAVSVGAINIGLNAGGSGNVKVESGASLTTTARWRSAATA